MLVHWLKVVDCHCSFWFHLSIPSYFCILSILLVNICSFDISRNMMPVISFANLPSESNKISLRNRMQGCSLIMNALLLVKMRPTDWIWASLKPNSTISNPSRDKLLIGFECKREATCFSCKVIRKRGRISCFETIELRSRRWTKWVFLIYQILYLVDNNSI